MKLTTNDFACVGMVAKHCNYEKLCIAIDEAYTFDLKPLLCQYAYEIDANWELKPCDLLEDPLCVRTPSQLLLLDILNGSEFSGCGGKVRSQSGLRKLLTYFAYSRYVMINNFDDTPNGAVTKRNEFSFPKPEKELKAFSNRYRDMAFVLWNDIEAFLCQNNYKTYNCKSCGCNGSCGTKVNTRGFGINAFNVTKR